MPTSTQGWPTKAEAKKVAKAMRKVGYKARVSKTKIRGYYKVIWSE